MLRTPKATADFWLSSTFSFMTLILFKDGKALDTLVGMTPKEKIEEFVKKSL